MAPMSVTFHKWTERRLSHWEAVRGKRTRIPGSTMALGRGDMPHDLGQMVVEAATGMDDGFWGSIAQGATFKSTGRKHTKPGRAVIAKNRDALAEAERRAGEHIRRWQRGEGGDVAAELGRIDRAWRQLPAEGSMTIQWPSLEIALD